MRYSRRESKLSEIDEFTRRHRKKIHSVAEPMDFGRHLPARLILLANGLALHAYRQYSGKLGLQRGDWRIISALGYLAPISYNDLANQISMDRAAISRNIGSLQRRGYVERHKSMTDKRQSILLLSKKGVSIHDRIAPIAKARQRRLESLLTKKELAMLERILTKFEDEIERMLTEAPPRN